MRAVEKKERNTKPLCCPTKKGTQNTRAAPHARLPVDPLWGRFSSHSWPQKALHYPGQQGMLMVSTRFEKKAHRGKSSKGLQVSRASKGPKFPQGCTNLTCTWPCRPDCKEGCALGDWPLVELKENVVFVQEKLAPLIKGLIGQRTRVWTQRMDVKLKYIPEIHVMLPRKLSQHLETIQGNRNTSSSPNWTL